MEKPGLTLFLLGVAAVLLVLVAILLRRITPGYKKKPGREQARAAEQHAGETDAEYARAGFTVKRERFLGIASAGVHAGIAFTQKVLPRRKSTLSNVVVAVRSVLRGDFSVTREGAADKFFNRMGFSDKVLTGDAAFDSEFFLESASREYVQAVFADAGNRGAVRALFALGFDRVELDRGEISATKLMVETRLMDLPILTGTVERLGALRTPPGLAGVPMTIGVNIKQIRWASIAGVLIATPLIIWAFNGTQPTAEGWCRVAQRERTVIALGYAALVAGTFFSLRGMAGVRRELALITGVLTLLAFEGWCAAMIANQKLDMSTLEIREVRVLNKYIYRGKNSTYCHLELESWRQDLNYVNLEVPCGILANFKRGQPVRVGTHAGRVGIEWIDSLDGSTH